MSKSNGWKKGSTVTAKAPIYFRVKDGETIDVVDIREEDVSLVVEKLKPPQRLALCGAIGEGGTTLPYAETGGDKCLTSDRGAGY